MKTITILALCIPFLALLPCAAHAQTGPIAEVIKQRRQIEEVIVTAQKREESLQDVPIAISAFSGEKLENSGIVTTKDMARLTPGLNITELAGYTFIYLRGVGSDAFIASADPSIATYVDGIYIPIGHGFAQELGGVERIEVLKGPQGTLFGRNSTGGAISVTTKRPGYEFEGNLGLEYGRFDSYTYKGYVSIPLGEQFGVSLAALERGSESYYTREGPNAAKGIEDDKSTAWRLQGRWSPTDSMELLLTAQRTEQNLPGSLVSANRHPSALGGTLGIDAIEEDYATESDTDGVNESYQKSVYGQFTWQLPWFDVKVLASDLLNDVTNIQTDFDGSSQPLVSFQSPHEYVDIQTAELQFLSNEDSWGSEWLTWVGGLYYLKSDAGFDPVILQVANSLLSLPELTPLLAELGQAVPGLEQILGNLPNVTTIDVYLEGILATESTSAFFQADVDLSDRVGMTVGARYQEETRKQVRSTVNLQSAGGGLTQLLNYPQQQAKETNLSPKVSFDFHPFDDDTLVYLSWAKGFKSHTYNIINIYTAPEFVEPEELVSYELGVKMRLLDGTLNVNAAMFQNETENLQSGFVSLLAGGAVRLENAGGAKTTGAEFDALWLPMPNLNPGLEMTLGASYLDSTYTSFKSGSGFDEDSGLQSSGQDYTGNRIVRTPRWTGNLGLLQIINTPWGPLEMAVDAYYNDGFFFLPQNGESSYEPSYTTINTRLSYLIEQWSVKLTVFSENLTDEQYNIAHFFTDFGRLDTQAPPVTYGARLNWNF